MLILPPPAALPLPPVRQSEESSMPADRDTQQPIPPGQSPDATTPQSPAFKVFGRVLNPDGPPVAGVAVNALHRSLRSDVRLGTGHTDEREFYAISYDPPDGSANADLFVHTVGGNPLREIGRSALFCHAPRGRRADVVAGDAPYRDYPEFERLTRSLEQHLDGAALGSLTAADVEFLACTTRQDAPLIKRVVAAHRDEERTGVTAAAFYGLRQQGLPPSLPALLSQRTRMQRKALERANRGERRARVTRRPRRRHPALAEGDLRRRGARGADEQQSTSLGGLLGTTGLSDDTQTALLTRYALHQGTIEEYWSASKEDPGVGPQQVAELQLILQLGTLAGGYVPMVQRGCRRSLPQRAVECVRSACAGHSTPPRVSHPRLPMVTRRDPRRPAASAMSWCDT